MNLAAASLLATALVFASCRAGAREGLGPTGVPIGAVRAPESATGPASAPATVWKAEYYKISDG
jgi:hypothetical protein